MNEHDLITQVLNAAEAAGASLSGGAVVTGPGDDAAVLRPPEGRDLVWTIDEQVEGVHFEPAWATWEAFGAKAAGASLSDLAAEGATPLGALLALHVPAQHLEHVTAIARGVGRQLAACRCPLVGGNLVRHPDRTTIAITALGSVPRGGAVGRGAAQPGDRLFVSGEVGWARLGLLWLQRGGAAEEPAFERAVQALLNPTPRLVLGQALAREPRVACMDLSDGLARDLPRLLAASGAAGRVDSRRLPGPPAGLAERVGEAPARLAWVGGEDYELLVAGPADLLTRCPDLIEIGAVEAGPPGTVAGAPGDEAGFDHFG